MGVIPNPIPTHWEEIDADLGLYFIDRVPVTNAISTHVLRIQDNGSEDNILNRPNFNPEQCRYTLWVDSYVNGVKTSSQGICNINLGHLKDEIKEQFTLATGQRWE